MTLENTEMLAFRDLPDEDKLKVINALINGDKVEIMQPIGMGWARAIKFYSIAFDDVYRIPTIPNEIDWSMCPVWAKYCAIDGMGRAYIYSGDPSEPICSEVVDITDFPFFKRRNNLHGAESLITRPEESE